jgi:hypothetical protein
MTSSTTTNLVVVVVEAISEVKNWLRHRPAEWYREGIQAVASPWLKARRRLR